MKTASKTNSKRLLKSGVVMNDTAFIWAKLQIGWRIVSKSVPFDSLCDEDEMYPAPTADELGELLPEWLDLGGLCYDLGVGPNDGGWFCSYSRCEISFCQHTVADTMADAMGLMLIFLKENGHLEETK